MILKLDHRSWRMETHALNWSLIQIKHLILTKMMLKILLFNRVPLLILHLLGGLKHFSQSQFCVRDTPAASSYIWPFGLEKSEKSRGSVMAGSRETPKLYIFCHVPFAYLLELYRIIIWPDTPDYISGNRPTGYPTGYRISGIGCNPNIIFGK